MARNDHDPRPDLGLRQVINASGTMTSLGASIMMPEAIAAMAAIAPQFVEMHELHKRAGAVVAGLLGAEAGTVTASTSAGVVTTIAACMTGADLGRIEQLPDTAGMRNEVVVQLGHMVNFGHPVEQDIRLAGAVVRPVGQATNTYAHQLAHALGDRSAAALFVVSHHTARFGMIPLAEFCDICHERDVPVIVDAASEYDLTGFLAAGADLVIYSGHKFLGGPTSGIVAGRKDLVRATYLQNFGIGRAMKVGKESIHGLMAALEAWTKRDHDGIRKRETGILRLWEQSFAELPGVRAEIVPDPTHNPLDRLRVHVDPAEARISAWELAAALAAGDPPVIVRDELVDIGCFELDPCNQHAGEPERVATRLTEEIELARQRNDTAPRSLSELNRERVSRLLSWPD